MGRSHVHRHMPIEAALALVAVLVLAPTAHAKITLQETIDEKTIQLKIYGFSQLEARGGDGYSDDGDLFFRAQRVRIGFSDADDASWTGLDGLADDAWGVSWQYRF